MQDPNTHESGHDAAVGSDADISSSASSTEAGEAQRPASSAKASFPGLKIPRRFTEPGEDVWSTVEWEKRSAVITDGKGEVVFEQHDIEVPKSYTQLATNVIASKYFRGHVGTPEREHSVRQLIQRVSYTMADWGKAMGYFASDPDYLAFRDELTHLLLHQKAAFNSPVWFNVGLKDQPKPQCSACQPYHARVLTEHGPMPIGDIVAENRVGLRVFDGEGLTDVVAVKHNGRKQVFRIELEDGFTVEATGDHLVCAHAQRRSRQLEWRRVDALSAGLKMRVYPHAARTFVPAASSVEIAEAALAGWLQADGFVGQYASGTNRSLTIEFLVNGQEEFDWVTGHLEAVFPDIHRHVRDVETQAGTPLRRIRLYGEVLRPFVEKYDLLRRSTTIRVPTRVFTASDDAVLAYLVSVFQSEGYITIQGGSARIGLAVISAEWTRDIQALLTRIGIYSRRVSKTDRREDRNNTTAVEISLLSERAKFARCVGFLSEAKNAKLVQSLAMKGKRCPDIRFTSIRSIEPVGETDVYDIQTTSGKYLSDGILVHNCFINSVDDTMESILGLAKTEGMLFKFGSGTGTNLSPLRSSRERLQGGGTASGPVSFMRGFDAFAGVIKSGGKTRRAAKMVILNVDHPDIMQFITCKADEEKKAWALIDAGYNGNFNVPGGAYDSVSYQNANHSVRVTDEFMEAYLGGKDWSTREVTTGKPDGTYRAADLMRAISDAAWVCGDPGMQYDTTINRWHTSKATDRIHASNPCSEYMFLNDSACNLASLNLMKFRREDGEFDVDGYKHACRILITAQEIIVDNASYPTERIGINSHDYRPLGLGYANLGALLMSRGVAYDSDAGRALAGALTAIMTGEAYHQSAIVARDHRLKDRSTAEYLTHGAFPGYPPNREAMLDVMRMHRAAVEHIDAQFVPDDVMHAARSCWDRAIELGERYGYRNAQATVLAPTGTIGFMMDCDTTGIEPDIAIVKYKNLVGGGLMKIVNNTVPEALRRLGYDDTQVGRIVQYIDEHDTIEGAPDLKPEHLPIFDCAFKPANGSRSIHYMGHVKMMAAAQPFISGAISKTVNMPTEATAQEITDVYVEGWRLGLKAIAIYRDGSKRTQPLSTSRGDKETGRQGDKETVTVEIPTPTTQRPNDPMTPAEGRIVRRKLPDERRSITHKFSIAGHEGYITVGMYEDGTPGEIFLTMSKEGSTISGLMDTIATMTSLALQYGVPLETLVKKFAHMRFEPSGITPNQDIRFAKSIPDYIFRWLGTKFLPREALPGEEQSLNGNGHDIAPATPPATPTAATQMAQTDSSQPTPRALFNPFTTREKEIFENMADAPACAECGALMVRNGACYKCLNCGSVFGCS